MRLIKKFLTVLCIFSILQTHIFWIADATEYVFDEPIKNETQKENNAEEVEEQEEKQEENVVEDNNNNTEVKDNSYEKEEELPYEVITEENNTTKNEQETVKETENEEDVKLEEVKEPINSEIESNIGSETSKIYKGYLYANTVSKIKYETNYNVINMLKISKLGDSKVIIENNVDTVILDSEERVSLENSIYYKESRVSVENFKDILGENGSIRILNKNNNEIGKITNQTLVKDGYYVFRYGIETDSVKFEFSDIINTGEINIYNNKSIKKDVAFSKNDISHFRYINLNVNIENIVNDNIDKDTIEGRILLEETESKIVFEMNNTKLSINEDNSVEIKVTLKTDKEKYELFENPSVDIAFPSSISDIKINSINLLYKNGLSLDKWEVSNDKVLHIKLSGAQSEYMPNSAQEGTTVIIYADLAVDKLTTSSEEAIKMTYTNQNTPRCSYVLEGKTSEDIKVNYVGKEELLTSFKASVGNSNEEISYNNDTQKLKVSAESEKEQVVTLTGSVINKYNNGNIVSNACIVGKIPCINNNSSVIDASNFNCTLISQIVTEGLEAKVYYSENVNAGKDDESWTDDISNLSKYKAYKIVISSNAIKYNEKLTFEFKVSIPENVGYNAKSFSTYKTYYKFDDRDYVTTCSIGIMTEEKDEVIVESEQLASIRVATQVSQCGKALKEGDEVYERQILRYTVSVTNVSNVPMSNVKIKGNATNSNLYYLKKWVIEDYQGFDSYTTSQYKEDVNGEKKYEELSIDALNPGESKTFEFQAIVNKGATETYGKVLISADELGEAEVNTMKVPVKEALVEVRVGYGPTEDINQNDTLSGGQFTIYAYVKNISEKDLYDIDLSVLIPSELYYNEGYPTLGAEGLKSKLEDVPEGQLLTYTIPKLGPTSELEIDIQTYIKELDLDLSSKYTTLKGYATVENKKYTSNDYSKIIKQSDTKVSYTWKSNVLKDTLVNGDEVIFTLDIKNTGMVRAGLSLDFGIDNGYEVVQAYVNYNNKTEQATVEAENVLAGLSLGPNESGQFIIKCKVDENLFARDQKTLESKVNVTGSEIESFSTNIISFNIINGNITFNKDDNKDDDNNNNNDSHKPSNNGNTNIKDDGNNLNGNQNLRPSTPSGNGNSASSNGTKENITYKIFGRVWIDRNKNGIYENEQGKSGIEVIVYGANSVGGIDINRYIKTVTTDDLGNYEISGLPNGNYIILFKYDTKVYNVTKYQVENARSDENSDAISKTVNLNNTTSEYAMTDVLKIDNSSLINIDLGLITINNFDLSLEKNISSVTLTNKGGTKVYEYDDVNDSKIEISSKYFKNSTLDITYKIVVKNDGDVTGYVSKIVDYLPEDTKFNIEKNDGWYYGDNGSIYYNGLVNEEIAPGTSRTIKLVVTKKITSGKSVEIMNSAEIASCTNTLGFEDFDSVPDNKNPKEDDFGQAKLLVVVSTGILQQNIILIILVIIIITVPIILYKRKKINR